MFRYRDRKVAKRIVERLKELNLEIRIMHVCGTHQDTLVRFGLSDMLKKVGVEIRQGPGCPVCVTTPMEIEEAITLAKKGRTIATFGDMLLVPGENGSLFDAKATGCDIRTVYSIGEGIEIAKKMDKDVIFMAIGFETTAPTTASTILNNPPKNFSVLTCHRAIPPAMEALLKIGELKIDGFIDPGHVSTIIGTKPYEFISEAYKVPQVIAGFEPLDLLMGVYMIAGQIKNGEAKVENEYKRVVKEEGNKKALAMVDEVFCQDDVSWRGFSHIPKSGFFLKEEFERYDARKQFEDDLDELHKKEFKEPEGCRCGEVLRGIIYSDECPLFGRVCTPDHPVGPCMVSREGSCNILLRYGM